MPDNRVFVYGTLKSGNTTRGLNMFPDAEKVGNAVTSDSAYSLYDLGSFPAVGLKGNNKISGEVWEVDDETFAMLDSIEGYPNFYNRKQIQTSQGKAWVYYIPYIDQDQTLGKIEGEGTVEWEGY